VSGPLHNGQARRVAISEIWYNALDGDHTLLGDQSAEARRMAANFAWLLELLKR